MGSRLILRVKGKFRKTYSNTKCRALVEDSMILNGQISALNESTGYCKPKSERSLVEKRHVWLETFLTKPCQVTPVFRVDKTSAEVPLPISPSQGQQC